MESQVKKNVFSFISVFIILVFTILAFKSADQANGYYTKEAFLQFKIEKKKKPSKMSYDKPDEAIKWLVEQRMSATGSIPADWRQNALKHIAKYNLNPLATEAFSWTAHGPGNIGGRIRAMVIHPTDTNTIYIGAASGGVWKTTDGAESWTPLKDLMENLAVNALCMDPANPDILYAGTGEGFFNVDALQGEGIFKTTDGGASWTQLNSTMNDNFYFVNKVAIDPSNGKLWAATRAGLFYSTDGGGSFQQRSLGDNSNVTDLAIKGSNIFVAQGLSQQGRVLVSTNNGESFSPSFTRSGIGRLVVAIAPSNPMIAYASGQNMTSNQCGALVKTTDAGASWNDITIPGPTASGDPTYTGQQAWYNNILAVHPTNPDIIYAAGLDMFGTTNGGTSWEQITQWDAERTNPIFAHADHHIIAFNPLNPNTVYVGNDGGVYRSINGGSGWEMKNNNLAITQFYYGAVHPTQEKYYGGAQDNGTLVSETGTNWKEIIGGDGGATEVDYNNPEFVYGEYTNFCFYKSTDGGTNFVKSMSGIPVGPGTFDGTTDRTLFITPFIMDPNNPHILLGGTYRVWRTTNQATSWTAISGDLTGDGTGTEGGSISTLAVAKGNSNVIYIGCTNGRVQVTTDGGGSWNIRDNGLPTAYATRIVVDPANEATAYISYSGFAAGNKVYKTTDYGSTWTNISGNLPNIPVNSLLVVPTRTEAVFAGTDLGVFTTTDGGNTWYRDGLSLPNVAIFDMDYRASDDKIFVHTHGRGTWSTPAAATSIKELANNPADFNLLQNYPNPFNPSTKIRFSVPVSGMVTVKVYDLQGKEIATLHNSSMNAGSYEVDWKGSDSFGKPVSSGIYFCRLVSGNNQKTIKMILSK